MKNKGKIACGVVIAVIVAVAGGFWLYTQQSVGYMNQVLGTNTIYEGISIDGVDVGGLTKEEALSLLEPKFAKEVSDKEIVFVSTETMGSEEVGALNYSDLDAEKDVKSAVEEAYSVARTESDTKANYKVYNEVKSKGYSIAAKLSYNEEKLDTFIEALDEEVSVEAKDSTIELTDAGFEIEDEVFGFAMDKELVAHQVVVMLDTYTDGEVVLEGAETQPTIKREDNEKVTNLLGSFSTKYTGADSLGRNINLQVGSDYISGTVLAPGEVFSTNEGLGDQSYAGGYKNAAVIVNGKLEDGIAGGVCQVSTTLYNAVVQAELEIIERKNHSLVVGYVPMGQDAAIAGSYKDLKFKNTTDSPIYIQMYAQNGKIVANIYGEETRSTAREVVLEHVYIGSYNKPPEKVTLDPELPEGERVITFQGKVGHKVSTYKVVYENGEFISREWFNDSVYSAVADEVSVGTGEKAPEEETTTTEETGGLPGVTQQSETDESSAEPTVPVTQDEQEVLNQIEEEYPQEPEIPELPAVDALPVD